MGNRKSATPYITIKGDTFQWVSPFIMLYKFCGARSYLIHITKKEILAYLLSAVWTRLEPALRACLLAIRF